MSHLNLEAPVPGAHSSAHAKSQGAPRRIGSCSRRLAVVSTLGLLLGAGHVAQAQELETLDTFTAIGRGETRATNSLNIEDLETSLPGLSLEKSIDVLPGVNVATTDPFGFYEFGTDIRLRSFRIDQVAVTVDGVPMGSNDPRYGTRATRVIDNENIGGIDVSQGAGDLTTPAYEALGGSIKYRVRMPSEEPAAKIKYTRGDFDAERVFARYDTGEILPGLTAYVSGSDFSFKTKGVPKKSHRKHMDIVTRYEFEKGFLSLQYAYNDRDDYDTASISYAEWNALENGSPSDYDMATDTWLYVLATHGYQEYSPFTNYTDESGNTLYVDTRINGEGEEETFTTTTDTGTLWQPDRWDMGDYSDAGRNYGPPAYIDPDEGPGDGVNAIYFDKWRNGRIDQFTRLVGELDVTDNIKLSGNTYYQEKNNYGLWGVDKDAAESEIRLGYSYDPDRTDIWPKLLYNDQGEAIDMEGNVVEEYGDDHAVVTPDSTAENPQPGIPGRTGRDEDFGGSRYGLTLSMEWEIIPSNTLVVGGWYDHDRHGANRPNYNLVGGGLTSWFAYDQPLFNNYNRWFDSDVYMGFIQDSQSFLNDRLTVTGGFKYLKVERSLEGMLSNANWRENTSEFREVTYKDEFLPQLGATFELTDTVEIFGNYSENMSAPDHGTLADATGFNAALSPEYAKNYDLGIRYSGSTIQTSMSVYYIKYEDRILAVPSPPGDSSFTTGQTTYRNVGGVDSLGVELGFDWRTPIENLRLIGSLALQETTFSEDLYSGTTDTEQDNDLWYTLPNPDQDPSDPDDDYLLYENSEDKDLGNTPLIVFNLDASYSIGDFDLRLGGKYYDSVYINTLNTQEIPDYVLINTGITWKAPMESTFDGLKLSLNVDNVFDEEAWYTTSYNDTDGTVIADRGRNIYFVAEIDF
ncbi:MAG: TonB-dependent receptor domain protein [Puniceicoccaceae bacterium 5H]|nr:MAG: TonB-dependent receptor domain protein [Puniceicoccaceae bacterium 5H]